MLSASWTALALGHTAVTSIVAALKLKLLKVELAVTATDVGAFFLSKGT